MRFDVRKFSLLGILFIILLLSPSCGFAEVDTTKPVTHEQIEKINKKLDESRNREEKILVGQDKILEEILTSRKWAKRK